MPLTRTSSGLLYQEGFSSLSGWTNEGGWTAVADPTLVYFADTPIAVMPPGPAGSGDTEGAREGHLYVEDGVWYLIYDSGDGVNGYRCFIAVSRDRGLTWARHGAMSMGMSDGAAGSYAATSTGWLEKRGATYYMHRITTPTTFAAPDYGLPASPYGWDIWSAPAPLGPWTFVTKITDRASWYSPSLVFSSQVLNGGAYTVFLSGPAAIGVATAPGPTGPYTFGAALSNSAYPTRVPEDPKVFSHDLGWVLLANAIQGSHTDRGIIRVSPTLDVAGFDASPNNYFQYPKVNDNGTIGRPCHVTGPDGALVQSSGYVPFLFDATPKKTSPGWHSGRSTYAAVLEPSASCFRTSGTPHTDRAVYQPLAHSDFVAEFIVKVSTGYPYFYYRLAGATQTANCYRVVLQAGGRGLLQKVVGGAASTVQANATAATIPVDATMVPVRVEAIGSRHRVWINSELHIDATDATYASGTHIAFSSYDSDSDIRALSIRSGNTITVTGLPPGQGVVLRSWGGLPVSAVTVAADGTATFTVTHGPHYAFDIDGVDYAPAGGIWGGDSYTLDGISAKPVRSLAHSRAAGT